MIDPTVRPAGRDDITQLEFLEREARDRLEGQRGADRWLASNPPRGGAWDATIDHQHVTVAHIDDVLVGYILMSVHGEVAVIDEVYVTEGAREVGFGDELLAAAMTAGRAAGCRLLDAQALPGDRNTKNLYERAEVKARLITVSAPL